MAVALYARVSTKDKRQDTENQLLQLRALCQQQGWTIYGEYVDRKTLTGRMAVDRRHAGHGYGRDLLLDALTKAFEAARSVASLAIVVDAFRRGATGRAAMRLWRSGLLEMRGC